MIVFQPVLSEAGPFANVIASPTLLLMVDGCIVCRHLPAGLSAVQFCQPPPSCGASLTLFPLGRPPFLLTIASCCPVALLPSINRLHRSH
jgi:hypothetical protein